MRLYRPLSTLRNTLAMLLVVGGGLAGCGGGSSADNNQSSADDSAGTTIAGPSAVNAGANADATGASDQTLIASASDTNTTSPVTATDADATSAATLADAGAIPAATLTDADTSPAVVEGAESTSPLTSTSDDSVTPAPVAPEDDEPTAPIPLQDVNNDGVLDGADIELILSASIALNESMFEQGADDLSAVLDALVDVLDTDGDGVPDRDNSELGSRFADLDADGIPDLYDDDVDGDGILNTDDADFDGVLPDSDVDGIPDRFDNEPTSDGVDNSFQAPTPASPCGQEAGSVADGSTNDWSDNCVVKSTGQGGQFANSAYTVGIQRIVYCAGFRDGDTYDRFATGQFDLATEAAVREYQKARGITADGMVGPLTWATLRSELQELETGIPGSQPDALGFLAGRCAGSVLFYQDVRLADDGLSLERLGFTLAGNPPNEERSFDFSIGAPFSMPVNPGASSSDPTNPEQSNPEQSSAEQSNASDPVNPSFNFDSSSAYAKVQAFGDSTSFLDGFNHYIGWRAVDENAWTLFVPVDRVFDDTADAEAYQNYVVVNECALSFDDLLANGTVTTNGGNAYAVTADRNGSVMVGGSVITLIDDSGFAVIYSINGLLE